MDDSQTNWDKEQIHTLLGYYQTNNTFIDLENNIYSVISYRNINKELKSDMLCCVNLRWSDTLNDWVLFQAVLIDILENGDDESTHHGF